MSIEQLIERIRTDEHCVLIPATGQPPIDAKYSLPADVREFYDRCGGAVLFEGFWQLRIVPPPEFVRANPVIVGELCEYDISSSWYIFARQEDGSTQLFTIDLDSARHGRCYDSFWNRYGLVGSTPIVAVSFTDFLERALRGRGRQFWWRRAGFRSLGDAYDGVELQTPPGSDSG